VCADNIREEELRLSLFFSFLGVGGVNISHSSKDYALSSSDPINHSVSS